MTSQLQQGGPEFTLPANPAWVEILKQKKAAAERTFRDHPFRAPERMQYPRAIIEMVDMLLAGQTVNTWNLSREFAKRYGFVSSMEFGQACAVISDVCKTGGQNVVPA